MMNNNRRASSPKLELTLNLSPPMSSRLETVLGSPHTSPSFRDSSCLSSCGQPDDQAKRANSSGYSSNNWESSTVTSMFLVGCPRCLMYVMLSEEANPKCPRCKSTVLLIILNSEPQAGAK